jgi:hypothetical protein
MNGETDMMEKTSVDSGTALAMWNAGKTLREIAAYFSVTLWSARWAVQRAESLGLGIARRGSGRPEAPEPPMVALWQSEQLTQG